MQKVRYILAIIALAILPLGNSLNATNYYTASQVLDKAANVLQGSKSVAFTISGSKSLSGTMKVSGKKFSLSSSAFSSWYDGVSLTTYNASTQEATIIKPSAQDLTEANPLSSISGWKSQYKAAFSSKKINGVFVVVLTPKSTSSGVKKAVLTVSKTNFYPKKLVISMNSGGTYTVSVSSIKSLSKVSASEFTFPKNKYKNAEIIDLR